MNQPKKKPLATVVAPTPRTPYTAAQREKDGAVNGAGAEAHGEALDRRVTEGFNLVHGRLDVIHEDVRENRRDIKGLRKELWEGLKEAGTARGRLAEKSQLTTIRAEMNERFSALEASQRDLRAEMNERFSALETSQRHPRARADAAGSAHSRCAEMNSRFAILEEGQRELIAKVSTTLERSADAAWIRRNIWVAVAAGTSLLVIGALLRPALERAVAALFGG